jgi:anti-anti-sigma regulatory factor
MANFSVNTTVKDGVQILEFTGYFENTAGEQVEKLVEQSLSEGFRDFIFDFSACPLINSPGIGHIIVVSINICDENEGNLYLTGLDTLKETVFRLSNVFPPALTAKTIDLAIERLKA